MKAVKKDIVLEKDNVREKDIVLFEKEVVVQWFKENRKDIPISTVESLLQDPAVGLMAAAAYVAGYKKSKERAGRVLSFTELEAEKGKKR